MKKMYVFTLAVLPLSLPCFAGTERGGGDVCQDRIEQIRNDLSNWIQAGQQSVQMGSQPQGSALLDFSKTSVTLAQYDSKMQQTIQLTRQNDQSSISCTDNPDDVKVDGVRKTCKAYGTADHPQILCYAGLTDHGAPVSGFMGLSEDDQYFQIHHEFAVLSGIEDQAGAESDYLLSDQVVGRGGYSGFLVDETVRRLAIRLPAQMNCDIMQSFDGEPESVVGTFTLHLSQTAKGTCGGAIGDDRYRLAVWSDCRTNPSSTFQILIGGKVIFNSPIVLGQKATYASEDGKTQEGILCTVSE